MSEIIDRLLEMGDTTSQRHWLQTQPSTLVETLVPALKTRADQLMRADVQACLRVVALMFEVARLTANPRDQALAWLAEANVRGIYLGEYQAALTGYDTATAIYADLGDILNQAIAQIGRLWPLANLGRTTEALTAGAWAAGVLETHAQWSRLADLLINLGVLHGRLGEDRPALALLDRARQVITVTPPPGSGDFSRPSQATLARVNLNRSIVLRNLGEFEAAQHASQTAYQIYVDLEQTLSAAKAQESQALTLLLMGRTNEALALLERVRLVFEREGLTRHAVLVELFISDCYLLLRRLTDVLEQSEHIVAVFDGLGVRFEVGQALVNAALAHALLDQPTEALTALAGARQRFEQETSPVWVAVVDLVSAEVYSQHGDYATAFAHVEAASQLFASRGLTTREAQARLTEATILTALGRVEAAETQARLALDLAADIPWLTYQAYALLGRLAVLAGQPTLARDRYHLSLGALERLRGAMMVEFRADFLRDKDEPYQALAELYLDGGQPEAALTIVERAKSRALVSLLGDRLDIRIQAQDPTDEPLVAELEQLRADRNRVYRRSQDPEWAGEGERETPGSASEQTHQEMLALERKITQGLHRLLVKNADYARQASLWQVQVEPIQPYLAEDTLLVEYYATTQQVVAFAVTRDEVKAWRLGVSPGDIERWLRPLWLNLKSTRDQVVAGQPPTLTRHAQALLQRLYTQLIAPLAETLRAYRKLMIVPHGALHYLPFHALHDGSGYLIQRHAVSYLPSASVLRYLRPTTMDDGPQGSPLRLDSAKPPFGMPSSRYGASALVIGHSHDGRLPYVIEEAKAIGDLLHCPVRLEDQATLAALGEPARDCQIIHLAAHGEFRADQPLFSGLRLADGQLTALDAFNLRLTASLVTLSACQTGLNVVGGGDELIGLTRGLFYAGASSLLLGHWAVEDRATATLMQSFYRELVAGQPKAEALRRAQVAFLDGQSAYAHPYFWAPFFLAGDPGLL